MTIYQFYLRDSTLDDSERYDYPVVVLRDHIIKFVDIGRVLVSKSNQRASISIGCRERDCVQLSITGKRIATKYQEGRQWNNETTHQSFADIDYSLMYNSYNTTAHQQEMNAAKNALEKLIAYYDNNGNQSTGQPPAKCYEWVALGEFNIGKWINGNGRETGSLQVGSDTKFYDRDELETHYKDYHGNCKSSAESALDNAINAMVLVGRHTDDIEAERKRIRAFYQGNLNKCQAHFKKLWEKYEGKFCE